MDKLYQDTVSKVYTDIEIVLIDPHNTISIHAHKCILGCMLVYFHNLFNFGKEKDQSTIKIKVNNATVANDFIMSFFYDQPCALFSFYDERCHGEKTNSASPSDTKYLLEMFECRHFFGLDNDVTLLYNIIVPPEDFDLFMQVIEEFDFVNDKCLIRTIKKNIPVDYDLNKFTLEFINELQFNDYLIVSGSENWEIKMWDTESGQLLNTLIGHTDKINSVTFSPDTLKIASCSNDCKIKIWETHTGLLLNDLKDDDSETINSVGFTPDSLRIASGNSNGDIKIWNAESGQLLNTLDGHKFPIQNVAFSLDGLKIISCCDQYVEIWDSHLGLPLKRLGNSRKRGNLYCGAIFSPDNSKIATHSRNGSITIWDAHTYQKLNTLTEQKKTVMSMAFSPDSLKITTGGVCAIKIWDVQTGQLLNTLPFCEHSRGQEVVWSVAFSPDGLKIASGSHEGIKIWDAQSGQLLHTLNDHTGNILSVAFSNMITHPIDIKLKKHVQKLNQ